jgi:hypothetical protein
MVAPFNDVVLDANGVICIAPEIPYVEQLI